MSWTNRPWTRIDAAGRRAPITHDEAATLLVTRRFAREAERSAHAAYVVGEPLDVNAGENFGERYGTATL